VRNLTCLSLYTARILGILWAGFWTWFGAASGIAEGLTPFGVLRYAAVPGLVFVLLLVIAWRWEAVGGGLLVLIGILIAVAYPMLFRRLSALTIFLTDLTLALPPLLAGLLFVFHWWSGKPRPA
jgi:hypothetical protein